MVTRCLFFHVQIILYGFDALDASGGFTRFIDSLLRVNEAAGQKVQPRLFNSDM
jgi:hypothetical protein